MNIINQTYSAKVRLGGNLLHEVFKRRLTPSEIYILRRIHGFDAVVAIEPEDPTGVEITAQDERAHLESRYGSIVVERELGPVEAPRGVVVLGLPEGGEERRARKAAAASAKPKKAAAAPKEGADALEGLIGA